MMEVNYSFVRDLLRRLGFENKWTTWMETCVFSSRMSILVDGSPTKEFNMECGLGHDDILYIRN